MKHNLITLFTMLLLLFNVTTEAKLPSAYASVMAHVEECDRVREISCRDNVSVELLTINRTGVSLVMFDYEYDANGNRKTVKDPDGLITSYNYDALNRVSDVINSQGITNYQYDRSSLQTQVNYPNGTQAKTFYDNAGRTKTISNLQNSAVISKFEYLLDDNGNRIHQIETQGALVETTNYSYDNNDRLTQTSVTGAANEITNFTYDNNYNRITEIKTLDGVATVNKYFTYNERGQVTKVTDNLDATNTAIYSYDNNGNRIKKDSSALTETYFYDVRDQLKEIKQGGSTIGQFLYDYQGLRVEKTTIENATTDTKKYVYDDQSVLVQTDSSGTTLSKYDYGSNRLLSLNNISEGAQFYLFDALGSPVNLTKNDGTVQARYQYDAFGNARSQTGESANVFGFTGHEKDEETGLYYFKARYYDPTLGQFLTQDAFEGMTDTPPSLHKYIYAYGNPTVYIDPDGNAAYLASGKEFDDLGAQLYSEGNKVGAAFVAVGGAFYKLGTGFFTGGLFDEANNAVTENENYTDAAKQFGNSVADTAKDVAKEYVEEGVVTAAVTVGGKFACGKAKAACDAIGDAARNMYDKLNKDIKPKDKPVIIGENPSGPNTQTNQRLTDEELANTEIYDRKTYGGSGTNGTVGQRIRKESEGQPCPKCDKPMVSETDTAPWPQHEPTLRDYHYNHGGKNQTKAERKEYAKSEEAYDGANCKKCQLSEGGREAAKSKKNKKEVLEARERIEKKGLNDENKT